MHIFITGATGLIGKELIKSLDDHTLTALTRDKRNANAVLPSAVHCITSLSQIDFNTVDVVINLAGEAIIDKRWSERQKQILMQSRIELTRQISEKINACFAPPHTFISGSAIGYYGQQTEKNITESTVTVSTSFSHQLCDLWEHAALLAQSHKTRVCLLRTAIVLAKNAGALSKMLPSFKMGLASTIATGEQGMSWIHIKDMVALILFVMHSKAMQGAINATAPQPVSNNEFSTTLARLLNRSVRLNLPAWLLHTLMGERAELLTTGQFVIPEKLQQHQFNFSFVKLEHALTDLLSN